MSPLISFIHDLVEENGKTIKENNLDRHHNIPIGSLTEVKWDAWFGGGACWKVHARLWVVSHDRDCDGSPLYALSRYKRESCENFERLNLPLEIHRGFAEDSLTVIKITDELCNGDEALQWPEEQK